MENLVNKIDKDTLNIIFKRYECGAYDHLLKNPRIPLSEKDKREALLAYLKLFHLKLEDDRHYAIQKIIENNNLEKLKKLLRSDQFFEEPLIHIANSKINI